MTTLYDRVGGARFFERLVDTFYAGVAGDEVLAALYPEAPDFSGRHAIGSRCSSCSTGAGRPPTPTSAATRGCGCATCGSTSAARSATAGSRTWPAAVDATTAVLVEPASPTVPPPTRSPPSCSATSRRAPSSCATTPACRSRRARRRSAVGFDATCRRSSVRDLRQATTARSRAVDGLSFDVGEGEVYALLGENGAGKSTTVEILEGHRTRTAGDVTVLGVDPRPGRRRLPRPHRHRAAVVRGRARADRRARRVDDLRLVLPPRRARSTRSSSSSASAPQLDQRVGHALRRPAPPARPRPRHRRACPSCCSSTSRRPGFDPGGPPPGVGADPRAVAPRARRCC